MLLLCCLFAAQSAHAVTYPTVNSTNFLSGSHDNGNATSLNYRYFAPKNYDANDTGTLYPLVLWLHGSGGGNTPDNEYHLRNNANGGMIFLSSANPDNQTDYPCFWVAPQSTIGGWNTSYLPGQIQGMLDDLIANYNIDPDRIYITGLSMGGGGTMSQINSYPERYAAANPICGWATSAQADAYAHIPLWAFHCANDSTVIVNGSDQIASQMRAKGGKPIYTRYNTGGHNGAWERAYSVSTPLVPWMMAQRRGQEPTSIVGPYVKVTAPTTSGNVSTGESIISFSGVADTDTTHVWYRNNQFYSDTPSAIGTTSWSVTDAQLRRSNEGKINEIYVQGETIAYAAPGNGLTTTNDFIVVTSVNGGDTEQPVVTITSPTSSSLYATLDATVDIAGTATDNVSVTSLSWGNSLGGSGSITLTDSSWQYGDIPLHVGTNVITITALDAFGNVGTDVITIVPTANLAPQVNAGPDDEVALISGSAEALLEGFANDDGLPEGDELSVQWSKMSGPGSVAFSNASEVQAIATFTVTGDYVLRLTADDSEETGFDEISITVHPEGTLIDTKYPTVSLGNFPAGSYDDGNTTTLDYRYFIPENYDENDVSTLYPLVLFLHGPDEKGSDNSQQIENDANGAMIFISTAYPDNQETYPCFWVAPQCQLSDWKTSYLPAQIQGMLDDLVTNNNIDPERIYITGLSMGGAGVVDQINNYSDRYAAANPVAGSVPSASASNYAHVPLWAFHCADDGTSGVNGSDQIVSQMRSAGGTPVYTRYDTGDHAASWARAYSYETPLVPWMMSQRLGQKPTSLVGPHIRVTSPNMNGSTATSESSLLLSGVADANTSAVRYRNSQYYNDTPPNVIGTTSWSVTATPLRGDRLNEIYIEADTVAYAALGNGKTTTNDHFTVSTDAYDIWAVDNGLELGKSSELELDPDGDFLNNLIEYAFGLDPSVSDGRELLFNGASFMSRGLPIVDWGNPASLQFTFPRRVDYASVDLSYTVQYSSDLENWYDSLLLPTILYTDGDIQIVEITDPLFAPGVTGCRFLRVSVVKEE
ncbi:PKD domain-containing protein [Rubritalea sp.]|uniref:carboxylesterase family protein n=1 Tax=Rubritalea sp. TaxID=2109375 RepID=UPI003EF57628